MLHVDPTLTKLAQARKRSLATAMLTIGLLGALLLFGGKKFFHPTFPFISAGLWWFPALILLFFLAIQFSAAQEGFLRRIESRRQAAAQGDKRFLASQQPEENAHALQLPGIFRLRLHTLRLLSALIFPLLLVSVGWLLYAWQKRAIVITSTHFWLFSGLFALVLLAMLFTFYELFSTEFVQVIEVTNEGLRTRYKGQEHSILWSDAQLFAFYGVSGDTGGRRARTYELSGSQTVVKWTEYQQKKRMWHLKTGSSFEEYKAYMVGLHAVITARTELPLYDLRQ